MEFPLPRRAMGADVLFSCESEYNLSRIRTNSDIRAFGMLPLAPPQQARETIMAMDEHPQGNDPQGSAGQGDAPAKKKRRRSRGFRRERPDFPRQTSEFAPDSPRDPISSGEEHDALQEESYEIRKMTPEQERHFQLNYAKTIGEPVIKNSGLQVDQNVAERKSQAEFARMMMAQAGELSGGRSRKPKGPGGRQG